MRKTKIVCTLGPTSSTPEMIEALINAGMNTARLNFSHGDHETHRRVYATVREISTRMGQPVAVLQDLQGPKIRVGKLPGGSIELSPDSEVAIVHAESSDDGALIPCSYPHIAKDVVAKDRILLDDGRLRLEVIDAKDGKVRCAVKVGGELSDKKGINLPGVNLSTPAVTEKDRQDIVLGKELGVDYVALSFVRSADDVKLARSLIAAGTPLLAKIEKPEALDCIEEIIELTDGIMVARGDLGVEMGPERVPLLQKELIEKANQRCKLVITATEMLDSMRFMPRPTRAEASDVANAVLDGSDAVMLSGETAKGEYPVRSVETMGHIINEIERSARFRLQPSVASLQIKETTNAVAHACVVAAREVEASAIICYMERDAIALLTSEYRPAMPLIAVTHREQLYRRLALHWGVVPLLLDSKPDTTDEAIDAITTRAKKAELIASGEHVVVVAGRRVDGPSDLLVVRKVD